MNQLSLKNGLSELDELCVNSIRTLSMDGVQKANSGHPGMPMGMAPAAYILWTRNMRHNPKNPRWVNRDRFVLSAGHGSMLLYSLLYLTGYEVSLDDLKAFRQWGSKTPGHPEYGHTPGVEVTTGPLGQGISNAVGMAIAEKYSAACFNRDGFRLIDYRIYVVAGDGCLQEGISGEASSLAGHLGLDNLVVIYDDNRITIDGDTDLSFSEDVAGRYRAYGWQVIEVAGDGNDMAAFQQALDQAHKEKNRPVMIKLRTHIGYGSPNKQDSHGAHGSPLGDEEIALTRQALGWPESEPFTVPGWALDHCRECLERGQTLESQWQELFVAYQRQYPELARAFDDALQGLLSVDIDALLPDFSTEQALATRSASGKVLNALMPSMPLVLGGSADLTPSNNTHFQGAEDFQKGAEQGRYIRFGVREHAMGAILNGISVSDLVRSYGGTFLAFADYCRPAIRLAALSQYPSIFVFTHDSIGVGEDGPTHQPVEHLASLRAIPGLLVFRPADANETAQCWKYMLEHREGPATIVLTRQNLPVIDEQGTYKDTCRGAYVVVGEDDADVMLLATGSEVSLAMDAREKLAEENIRARVVSMPSWELFQQQDAGYREKVIPASIKARVGIEAAIRMGWDPYLGDHGEFVGMTGFGASAPGGACFQHFGITVDNVVDATKRSLEKVKD